MLNKICVDADYNIELVIWLQDPRTFDYTWDNSIVIHVNADDTANQELVVFDGEESTTISVTSGTEQDIDINGAYWNMGGDTTVSCYKNGTLAKTFTFTFPDIIDAVGMLNQDENEDYHFTMTGSSAAVEIIEEQVQQNTSEISEAKEDINYLYENKQNFIHADILPPSGSGDEGDLEFYGNMPARLYRRENNAWSKKEWIAYGQTNPDAAPVEGDIFIENNGANLTRISQYIGGIWIDYTTGYGHIVDYRTTEQDTEVEYLDGSHIFQRSFYLDSAISLVADTWTNAIQNNTIGEIIRAEGKNANGDMIALIGRVNNGYAQVMSLMSAAQSLKVLTLQYIKATGGYAFNDDYQQGTTYTFAPTIDAEEFFLWLVKHFISVCKTKWASSPTYSYILNNLTSICSRFMQYKENNKGIGILLYLNTDYNSLNQAFGIYVTFTNGNKTARVAESYSEHGDDSKYLWGNESQSSLWAKNGEYLFTLTYQKDGSSYSTQWTTPEWAYTMYCRYLGVKFSSDTSTYLGTENLTNYGIHLT